MSVFQLLSCDIALGGDTLNVVVRHQFNAVTYPEMLVLKYLHGDNSVTNIYDVGAIDRDEADEYTRLSEVYGADLVRQKMFPGAGTRLPGGDNRYGAAPVKQNPPEPVAADAPLPDATAPPPIPAGQTDYSAVNEDKGKSDYKPSKKPVHADPDDPFAAN